MNRRRWLGALAALSVVSLALALVAQHHLGMQPCPWCVLQRVVLCATALVAVLGAALPPFGQRLAAWGLAGLSAGGAAAALYQNLVAAKSASCNLTLADRIISGLGLDTWLPDVFEVRASCADGAVSVFGVPFELWSLILFVAMMAVAVRLGRRG